MTDFHQLKLTLEQIVLGAAIVSLPFLVTVVSARLVIGLLRGERVDDVKVVIVLVGAVLCGFVYLALIGPLIGPVDQGRQIDSAPVALHPRGLYSMGGGW